MTHRTIIQKDVNAGQRDEQNNPLAPDFEAHAYDVPCYWYVPNRMQPGLQVEPHATMYEHEMLMPLGTEVSEGDRLQGVTKKNGDELTDQVFTVLRVMRHPRNLRIGLEVIR
jgi:hypothetical protein